MNDSGSVSKDDWRRQGQEHFLKGCEFSHAQYKPYRAGWDHDHCEFCGDRFALIEGALGKGYCTQDGYRWVCEQCFADFRVEFNWTLVEGTATWSLSPSAVRF